jgi:iron-sulfur cluster assembly protein
MASFGSFKIMSVTEAAAERVREIVAKSNGKAVGLRVGVKNGGCAGMSYTVELAEAAKAGEDQVEAHGALILVDPKAVLFLLGTEMDFERSKLAAQFVFRNPNQTSACGCGESVALTPAEPPVQASA